MGGDADLLVIGPDMEIEHVIARGIHLVDSGRPTVMSLYEPGRTGHDRVLAAAVDTDAALPDAFQPNART